VNASTLGDARAQGTPHPTQVAGGRWRGRLLGIVGEDTAQVLIVIRRPRPGEVCTLRGVMLLQRVPQ
jgi:hypothetical protein